MTNEPGRRLPRQVCAARPYKARAAGGAFDERDMRVRQGAIPRKDLRPVGPMAADIAAAMPVDTSTCKCAVYKTSSDIITDSNIAVKPIRKQCPGCRVTLEAESETAMQAVLSKHQEANRCLDVRLAELEPLCPIAPLLSRVVMCAGRRMTIQQSVLIVSLPGE